MDKLTENYFESGNILYADDLNILISKINNIIDNSTAYNDSEIRQLINSLDDSIQQLNNTANAEKDRLDGVIDDIDTTIQERIDQMMQDKDFLDELKEGIQSSSNFGVDDVDLYLQQVGLISRTDNSISYGWSTLEQQVDSIRQSVNNLIETGVDTTAIQSQINQYVDDAIANLDISTMYAKKDAESIIEWMYSALKQSTSADKTFTQIASAGKDELSSAISELRTYVEKLKNGDYVATASLEASVDNAIAGLKSSASSNSAKTEIFNKIDKNSQDIAGIVTSLTGNSSSASISTKIGNWKAGLVTESYVNNAVSNGTSGLASTGYVNSAVSNGTSGLASTDYVNNQVSGAVAGLMAASDFTSASVIAKVNEGGSSVRINADRINIDSSHQLDLSSQNISIKASDINLEGRTWALIIDAELIVADTLDATSINAQSLLAKGSSAYPRVVINSNDGIKLQTSYGGNTAIHVRPDGSGELADGNLSWDTSGNLTILAEVGSGSGIRTNAINLTDANSNDTGLYLVDQSGNSYSVGIDNGGFLKVNNYASGNWS